MPEPQNLNERKLGGGVKEIREKAFFPSSFFTFYYFVGSGTLCSGILDRKALFCRSKFLGSCLSFKLLLARHCG